MGKKYVLNTNGLLPDPIDERDALASNFLTAVKLPAAFRLADPGTPIKMQGNRPSCGGQSGSGAGEYLEFKETGVGKQFSARAIYAKCKALDGYPNMEGTFTRIVAKVIADFGQKIYEEYPENFEIPYSDYIKEVPLDEKYKGSGYVRIAATPNNFEEIKQFIYQNNSPAIVAITGSNVQWTHEAVKKNGYVVQPPREEDKRWGHLVIVVGWREDGSLLLRNSWGKNWGDGGYAWIPLGYTHLQDVWGVMDLPNDWKSKNKVAYSAEQAGEIVSLFYSIVQSYGHPAPTQAEKEQHIKAIIQGLPIAGVWQGFATWLQSHMGLKGSQVAIEVLDQMIDELSLIRDKYKNDNS